MFTMSCETHLTYKISSAYEANIFGYMHCLICPLNCINFFSILYILFRINWEQDKNRSNLTFNIVFLLVFLSSIMEEQRIEIISQILIRLCTLKDPFVFLSNIYIYVCNVNNVPAGLVERVINNGYHYFPAFFLVFILHIKFSFDFLNAQQAAGTDTSQYFASKSIPNQNTARSNLKQIIVYLWNVSRIANYR
ncbi:hypothetical protein AGLY_002983 [Aphis glycines]|uniref:Uncharacterized protein n=1 Tax=Aphis glycines TaxID=307491 RepID=A0A6G0U461_APHGL|nr:hypothetical protein AGLY_002983 [Aphis glycines]